MPGDFIGVGVGPGDPELITLKAARYIQNADVISYIASGNGRSQAKVIAGAVLKDAVANQREIPVVMPMCEDRSIANKVYDEAAEQIQQALNEDKTVVFLCEGDPLFFGSFSYLLERIQENNPCQVVPGISSVNAAASALQLPLTILKESFVVVSGRHTEEKLCEALLQHDSVVIMKAGRSRQKIVNALKQSNRLADANYLEYIGRENEVIYQDVDQLPDESGPYFSLFVVLRNERDQS
ncbi:MAG: precorrin-2 C(20)-methyltransferase [Pseudomonadales bacterium]|nr:precorrin-2 C(20)-methyltransferase [Pseudomonadales bacterium]